MSFEVEAISLKNEASRVEDGISQAAQRIAQARRELYHEEEVEGDELIPKYEPRLMRLRLEKLQLEADQVLASHEEKMAEIAAKAALELDKARYPISFVAEHDAKTLEAINPQIQAKMQLSSLPDVLGWLRAAQRQYSQPIKDAYRWEAEKRYATERAKHPSSQVLDLDGNRSSAGIPPSREEIAELAELRQLLDQMRPTPPAEYEAMLVGVQQAHSDASYRWRSRLAEATGKATERRERVAGVYRQRF